MGSSGGGNYKAPATQTPAGPIAPYGQSTAPGPTAMGVLPSSGDPMTMEMMAQAWANPQWSAPPPPPPAPMGGINPAMLGEFEKMRNQLAAIQARNKMEAENKRQYALSLTNRANGGVGGRSSSSGYGGSARGGASGGSSARR